MNYRPITANRQRLSLLMSRYTMVIRIVFHNLTDREILTNFFMNIVY